MTNEQMEPPVAPHLVVSDGRAAIEFYGRAFGAELVGEPTAPDDGTRVLHASLTLNGGMVHLSDDFPDINEGQAREPHALGDTPVTIALTLADPDALWARAVEAGADPGVAARKPVLGFALRRPRRSVRPPLVAGHTGCEQRVAVTPRTPRARQASGSRAAAARPAARSVLRCRRTTCGSGRRPARPSR